jgi:hypothetical protein
LLHENRKAEPRVRLCLSTRRLRMERDSSERLKSQQGDYNIVASRNAVVFFDGTSFLSMYVEDPQIEKMHAHPRSL